MWILTLLTVQAHVCRIFALILKPKGACYNDFMLETSNELIIAPFLRCVNDILIYLYILTNLCLSWLLIIWNLTIWKRHLANRKMCTNNELPISTVSRYCSDTELSSMQNKDDRHGAERHGIMKIAIIALF